MPINHLKIKLFISRNLSLKRNFGERFLLLNLIMILILLNCFRIEAASLDCSQLSEWQEIKEQIKNGLEDSILVKVKQRELEFQIRKNIANQFYKDYRFNNLKMESLYSCLSSEPDRRNFLNTVQSAFYEGSLKELRNANSPVIKKLVKLLDKQLNGQVMLYRMINHYESSPDLESKAGFYRGARSIFMNIDSIPSNEWLLIFTHELVHALDDTLWTALDIYSNKEWVKEFTEWSNKEQNPEKLPSELKNKLKMWLEAGLNRGFWAEYRAWLITFEIYKEGLINHLWQPIDWVETILNSKQFEKETTSQLTYRYLNSRFTNPTEGIFSLPLIKNALYDLRSSYGPSSQLPELGNFQSLVN
jgi:hypothetical protein